MTLHPKEIISWIDTELNKKIDSAYHSSVDTIINTGSFHFLGIRTPSIRKIANTYFHELKSYGIKEIDSILPYCDYLLSKRVSEHRTIAFQWSFKCKGQFLPKHFSVFERWLKTSVTGWGSCDDLCTHTFGHFLFQYPEFIPQIKAWTRSSNPWIRRASAIIFIYSLRRSKYLDHIFSIADALFNDPAILVLKGYGWMLKEASNHFREEVYQYVLRNKATMPRVSLRYAIEKMPNNMRKEAMSK